MKKKVLVAEDDPQSRKLMELILEESGYDFLLTRDGKEAVEKFSDYKPDIVLTDLFMPNMNGIQTFLAIRQIDANVPVLAFTGACSDEDMEEAKQLGFDEFIPKPIEQDKLLEIFKKYLT
ncbi:MAG: response regulator [Bacteroidota bacterium]